MCLKAYITDFVSVPKNFLEIFLCLEKIYILRSEKYPILHELTSLFKLFQLNIIET